MRTKDEIIQGEGEDIDQAKYKGQAETIQAGLILEVLIDIRDMLGSIDTRLKEIDKSIYTAD